MRAILRPRARATSENRQAGASAVRKFLRREVTRMRDSSRHARRVILRSTSALFRARARRAARASHTNGAPKKWRAKQKTVDSYFSDY
jgi:hypothetical protein